MTAFEFTITDVAPHPAAAAPTLLFRLRIARPEPGPPVHALALRVTPQIDTRRRRYTAEQQQRLYEVFGEPPMWDRSLTPLTWAQTTVLATAFDRETVLDVPIPCTYDFDVAAAKYLHAVTDGTIPLQWFFTGTAFHAGERGFMVSPVAWESHAASVVPARLWRETMDRFFPNEAWIRISRATLDALHEIRGRRAEPGWDRTIQALIGADREASARDGTVPELEEVRE